MSRMEYVEKFKDGPGGWYAWISNFGGPKQLEFANRAVTARSPWWIDYNHAPPGAGYLHMLACLATSSPEPEAIKETGGPNRFIASKYPTDFTNATMSVRLKGELLKRDAELLVLVQGGIEGICSGWLLTGQPLQVTNQWTEQRVTFESDLGQWTALGSRHDRTDTYGVKPLEQVLQNVDVNIMLVMFPLNVVPMGSHTGDSHVLRAGHDYPVWQSKLPEGYIILDEIRIQFAREQTPENS
jgi:hypothetical protein